MTDLPESDNEKLWMQGTDLPVLLDLWQMESVEIEVFGHSLTRPPIERGNTRFCVIESREKAPELFNTIIPAIAYWDEVVGNREQVEAPQELLTASNALIDAVAVVHRLMYQEYGDDFRYEIVARGYRIAISGPDGVVFNPDGKVGQYVSVKPSETL